MGVREYNGKVVEQKIREYNGEIIPVGSTEDTISRLKSGAGVSAGPSLVGPSDQFSQSELPSQETIAGQAGPASMLQKLVTPGIEAPFTIYDLFSTAGAVAGSAYAPQVALPSSLAKAEGLLPSLIKGGIELLPKSIGAGIGGGVGGGVEEAIENPKANLLDILASADDNAKTFALAELTGGIASKAGGKLFDVMTPKVVTQEQKDAIKFAREKSLPIPINEVVREGLGGKTLSLTQETNLGNFIVNRASKKINTYLDAELQNASKQVYENAGDVALKSSNRLTKLAETIKNAKNESFEDYLDTVGRTTELTTPNVLESAKIAMRRLKEAGETGSGASNKSIKVLEGKLQNIIDNQDARLFESVDGLRKSINGLKGSGVVHEVQRIMREGYKKDYDLIGQKLNFDLNSAVEAANASNQTFRQFMNTGGLKNLQSVKANGEGYIRTAFKPENAPALKMIRDNAPEVFDDLLKTRLNMAIAESTAKTEAGRNAGINIVDGIKLDEWYGKNKSNLADILGKDSDQLRVFENFVNYTKHTSNITRLKLEDNASAFLKNSARLTGLGGAFYKDPTAGILTGTVESTAGYLSHALTNPNSALFKLFAEKNPTKLFKLISGLPIAKPASLGTAEYIQETNE